MSRRVDGGVLQHLGHLALHDAARQPLGDGGLADAGIADIKRIVLGAAAENLDGAVDLGLAADQRVDLAVARLLVEIDAIGVERVMGALRRLLGALRLLFLRALDAAGFGAARRLGDAVRDIVHRVEARHVLLLQEIDGVAFALGEHRHQHIGAGHFLAARGLDVDRGALQHALEAGGRLGVLDLGRHQIDQFVVDIIDQLAAQFLEIDRAGAQHRHRILVLGQGQQQMLERRVFVPAFIGIGQGAVQGLFKVTRQHESFNPFPRYIAADAGAAGRNPSPGSPWSRRPRRYKRRRCRRRGDAHAA